MPGRTGGISDDGDKGYRMLYELQNCTYGPLVYWCKQKIAKISLQSYFVNLHTNILPAPLFATNLY